jgi:hypothetical protein
MIGKIEGDKMMTQLQQQLCSYQLSYLSSLGSVRCL